MSKEKYEPRLTEIEELEKKGIELLPIEEVKTEKLKPNSNNKIFDPLSGKDYDRLKEDICKGVKIRAKQGRFKSPIERSESRN
jgi:hypothetical protein